MYTFENNLSIDKKIKLNDLFFLISSILIFSIFIYRGIDLPGFLGLLSSFLITIYFAQKKKLLSSILYTALITRLITIFISNNLMVLPDSWGDTDAYELQAWEWSKYGFLAVIKYFPKDSLSYNISWILAFFYSISDRSIIMAQSINLIFGISSVYLGSHLASKIWNEKAAIKTGWLLAFYPTLVMYSGYILRESFVWFFLLVALYGIHLWIIKSNIKAVIIILIGFIGATFYHGGMVFGGIIFLFIGIFFFSYQFIKNLINLKFSKKNFLILISCYSLIFFIFVNINHIPKLNSLTDIMSNFEAVLLEIKYRNISNAGYPDWTVPKNLFEFFYKAPIRVLYFLFAPFPWDITKLTQVFGLFDGVFHIILYCYLIKYFKYIWKNKTLKIYLIILVCYIIIFGLSTGNFGTAVRHRTKFLITTILLVAPFLPNIFFSLKKIKNFKN